MVGKVGLVVRPYFRLSSVPAGTPVVSANTGKSLARMAESHFVNLGMKSSMNEA